MNEEHTAENDAWSYAPHEGPHEFRPWCVYPPDWWAPGCTCGVIRSAGPRTETEEAMREWWEKHTEGRDDHATTTPIPPGEATP